VGKLINFLPERWRSIAACSMEPDLVMVRMGKGEVLPAAEEGAEGGGISGD